MENNEEIVIPATGAFESEHDFRTVKFSSVSEATAPLVKGGAQFLSTDILNQRNVGICTAISFIQNRNKANGRKYSYDFQYLLQKKYIDQVWFEGSSIFAALKVGKTYGLLPIELWTHTTEADLNLPYSQYIAKLEAIPLEEILRLLSLCIDKIPGYAQIDQTDSQAIARAINDSDAGILCRYSCQKNWWTAVDGHSSYDPKDIDPLRNGPETSGHAIDMTLFDYTVNTMQLLANTWGPGYCLNGSIHINWQNYKMTEAWTILKTAPAPTFPTLKQGSQGDAVKTLQADLNKHGAALIVDGNFGPKTRTAVINYQLTHQLTDDGVVGKLTWASLQK